MNTLKEILSAIHPLPQSEWEIVEHTLQREEVAKNEMIVSKGQIENYLYFIEKGILRAWVDRAEQELLLNTMYKPLPIW